MLSPKIIAQTFITRHGSSAYCYIPAKNEWVGRMKAWEGGAWRECQAAARRVE
jgi:hypothetical protein